MIKYNQSFLIRIAVSIIFIVFGAWEVINPNYWSAFLPQFLANLSFYLTIIVIHGIVLFAIGISLVTGFKKKIAASLGTLIMLAIVIDLLTTSDFTPLLIRDFVITLVTASIIFEK